MVRNCDRLSAEELWRFHNDGFVVPDCRLPQDVVAEMREAYDELLSANPGFSSDFMLGPHLETTGAQGVRGSRRWLSFVTRPELLDMVEQLIGEDIILWGTTIFGKPAHGGKATPWHQDGAYYPIRPLETLSIWIALDDAVPDNGCMRFIHGSRANLSSRRRAALVGRFMPGHCHYDHELGLRLAEPHKAHDYGKRALFLLRGRDRSGRNDFSVGH